MTAAQAALEEDEEDDDGGEEKTPKKAALKGLAEAYASEDDEDDEDDDDENEVDEASDKEAEDDGQFFDTSFAPSKAAEPVQKSATCCPPETPIQRQARPRTRKEWKCRKKLQPQDSDGEEEGDEDEEDDESQRPPKAQQTFAVVNLESEHEEVAIIHGPQPKPPRIVINDYDDDDVTEVMGPQTSEDTEVEYFLQWFSSLEEFQMAAFSDVLIKKANNMLEKMPGPLFTIFQKDYRLSYAFWLYQHT